MIDPTVRLEREYLMSLLVRDTLPDGIRVVPDELSVVSHREILQAIYDCEEAHGLWDCATVLNHLYLQKSKFYAAMQNVSENIEVLMEAGPRAELIREAAKIRQLREQTGKAMEAFGDDRVHDGLSILDDIRMLSRRDPEEESDYDIGKTVEIARKEVEERLKGRTTMLTLNTPLLDESIGGLAPGTMLTIGGTTTSGKSSLVLYLAIRMSHKGTRVGVVSLEDPMGLWGSRTMSLLSGIPISWVYTGAGLGGVAIDDFTFRADNASREAQGFTIRIANCTGAKPSGAIAAARRLIADYGCDVLIVDYLQAARFDLKVERYDKSVADLSKQLKGLCNEAGLPLIVTSQLKRRQGNPYAEPHMFDLKESGDLEIESDVIMLLWKDSDKPDAKCLGKVSKVKWSQPGLRFELTRDRSHGMIIGLEEWQN